LSSAPVEPCDSARAGVVALSATLTSAVVIVNRSMRVVECAGVDPRVRYMDSDTGWE